MKQGTKLLRLKTLSASLVGSAILLISCTGQGSRADLVLHNGVIWTVDESNPRVEAVAIRDGKFVAVGSNEEILGEYGTASNTMDLAGKFVVPGFNDNHVHFASAARFLEFNIMKTNSQEEFIARVKDVVGKLPKGDWILGGMWGAYDQWTDGSVGSGRREPFTPNMKRVEELTKDNPMFIRKFDNSQFAANSTALRAVGLSPSRKSELSDIRFSYNEAGEFTGILVGDGVIPYFSPKLPDSFSHERRVEQTKRALAEIRKHGVTNVSDMSDDEQLEIYRELHAQGELTVRVHFRYHLERWKELADQDIKVGSGDEWIRLGALKGHIDGIMGSSSARFFEPYTHDATKRGRWRRLMVDDEGNFVQGKFLKYMLGADKAGQQITVHAIGDEANHLLLNYLDELNAQNGQRDRRFRLVHAQVIAGDDFDRLGELDVIAEVQPFHLSDDMRWMEERIGYERCKGAYAFKSISEGGGLLSFGTDWPGTAAAEYPINPMLALYAAVSRQTISGEPVAGWFPGQTISMADAIKAYTYNTAFANFEEDIKGSIEVGKVADLAILTRNLLEIPTQEILQTEVAYTIVDGRVVFQKEETNGR